MSCCDELKTLTIFKSFPTRFSGRPLVTMDFQSEGLDLNGFKAYFTLCGVTKVFNDITSPVEVDFSAEETSTFPIGLNYAEIIVEDLQGHKHPFSTSIPCMTVEWQEGNIELSGFDVTITTEIQENTIVIKFENGGGSGTFNHDELIHRDYEDQHPISAITGLEDRLGTTETSLEQEIQDRQDGDTTLQQNIGAEALNRQQADTALGNRIDAEAQAREDEDGALDQRIDEVVGDLGDHVNDKDNPHEVTKEQVGLGNVDNTSDMSKPVSTAQGNAIRAVQDNLDDETDARQLADQGLQDQIDNLPTSTDVSDAISAHNTSETAHSDIRTELGGKQATLVSGTNIKTVNGDSILGSGNLEIDALPTQSGHNNEYLKTNGTSASWSASVVLRKWED